MISRTSGIKFVLLRGCTMISHNMLQNGFYVKSALMIANIGTGGDTACNMWEGMYGI